MTKWQYQYRAFGEQDPTDVRDSLASSGMNARNQEVTDTYAVGPSDFSVRVRGSQLKVKGPESKVDALVDKVIDDRYYFPVESTLVEQAIGAKPSRFRKTTLTSADDVVKHAARKKDVVATDVKKNSVKYEQSDFEVEVTAADISGKTVYTVCVAANDPAKIHDVTTQHRITQWQGAKPMEYAEAIRTFNS